jgi:hypothetical protein
MLLTVWAEHEVAKKISNQHTAKVVSATKNTIYSAIGYKAIL